MTKRLFYKNGVFIEKGKVHYFYDVLYMLEKGIAEVYDVNNNKLHLNHFLENETIKLRYALYKYLKEKGYIVGAGLKYGGVFRVYEKIDEHSKWIIIPVKINEKIEVYDFSAKNRVAHSTKKKIVYSVVHSDKIRFIEIEWIKL